MGSEILQRLLIRIIDEDHGFSFELVVIVDPRFVAPVSLQCRFSMSLVTIQAIACPRPILARILRGQIGTPKRVSFFFVFFVDVFEAAVVLGVNPAVVMVLVSYPDLEFTRMVL